MKIYHKKECITKVSDYVRVKQLKNIKVLNKGNDNSTSTNILDYLLKIPPEIYLKEDIISFLDNVKINLFIKNSLN